MSEHDLPPLDADLRALVKGARDPIAPPVGAEARVLAGVEALVLGPLGGGGSSGGPAAPGASAGRETAPGLRKATWIRLGPIVASFVIGGVVGAGLVKATIHPPAPVVTQLPPAVVYLPAPTGSAAVASAPPPSSPSPSPVRAVHAAASAAGNQDDLSAERSLLDVARGAIERGDGAAALAATREHERRFPSGMLVQEREAMAVRALVLLGRTSDARVRAARFRARYPESALLPALESALEAPSASP